MNVWIVVEVYQGVVNEVRAYETEELAEGVAGTSFEEHLSGHQANENDRWILKEDDAKEPYGSCPCGEYDILVFESPVHGKSL